MQKCVIMCIANGEWCAKACACGCACAEEDERKKCQVVQHNSILKQQHDEVVALHDGVDDAAYVSH